MQGIDTMDLELCYILRKALFIVLLRPLYSGFESNDSCILGKRLSLHGPFIPDVLDSLKHLRRGFNSTQTAGRFHLMEEGPVRVPTPRLLFESVRKIVSRGEEFGEQSFRRQEWEIS